MSYSLVGRTPSQLHVHFRYKIFITMEEHKQLFFPIMYMWIAGKAWD